MGLTEKLGQIKTEAESLIRFANDTTKANDDSIGDAILHLVEGFGQGGEGGGIGLDVPNVADISKNIAYMFSAFKNGNISSGTKTWTEGFSNTQEELALETGLSEIHGIIINYINGEMEFKYSETAQSNKFVFIFVNGNGSLSIFGSSLNVDPTQAASTVNGKFNVEQGTIYQSTPTNGSIRFDGGNMYCRGRYNKNVNYQLVLTNIEYEWVAW